MTTENKPQKSGSSGVKSFALGASLASLAAASYFFMGPNAKKNQSHLKSWVIKMKGDVVGKLEAVDTINKSAYHEIIDTVAAENEKAKKAEPAEIKVLAQDLKKHWKTISAPALAIKKDVAKISGATVKKIKKV